ncbi:MAG: hypothetical protein DWQ37_16040 [Planctomycetota bacterium]|nr:MAG: hypothetical protein DWQ37_16040 [Planctomycetota bacterium]
MADAPPATSEATTPAAPLRRRLRFSLTTLLLLTTVICVAVSHFHTSRQLQETRQALAEANSELGNLTIDDPKQYAILALPNFGPGDMQWRWRVHLPTGKRDQFRWAFDNVPESGLPQVPPRRNRLELLDRYAKPAAKGEPMIITLALWKNVADEWKITLGMPGRETAIDIRNPPAWLDNVDRPGWGSRIAGRKRTEAHSVDTPLVLLRMRKSKQVPPNGSTVDMQPTDGLIVWIEELPEKTK